LLATAFSPGLIVGVVAVGISYSINESGGVDYFVTQMYDFADAIAYLASSGDEFFNNSKRTYNYIKDRVPLDDPALQIVKDLYADAGKSLYGDSWTPEGWGVNTNLINPMNPSSEGGWNAALLDAYEEFVKETGGSVIDFWDSEYCPPSLKGLFNDDGGRGNGTGGDGHGGADEIPEPHRDPIFIDLNRNGKIDASNEAYFDLNNNGFREKTAWMSEGDGALVMDRNGNGVIDNGAEFFGDATLLQDGTTAQNGFHALAELDSDGNGVIDASDEKYAHVKVWVDYNNDGISTENELMSLQDAGIKAIHLSSNTNGAMDENGNIIARTGTFEWEDNAAGILAEMLLSADYMRNVPSEYLKLPDDIAALPELMGGGLMYDLRQAMVRDENGTLKSLLEDFIAAEEGEPRKEILRELVFAWSGVGNIAPNSRGNFIDARELGVLEKYSGRPFVGTEGPNPHENAAPVLKKTYETLMGHFYRMLLRQTDYAEFFTPLVTRILRRRRIT
jgi:hypothetical protein